jgi:hypothetical protein
MSKDVDSASALSDRPTEYERGWRDAQEKCAKICDEHATNALIAADAEISGGPVEDSWLSTARAHQRSAAAIRGLAWDALKTASQADKKEGAGEQQSDASEPDEWKARSQELDDENTRLTAKIVALQSRLERAEQDAKRWQWARAKLLSMTYVSGKYDSGTTSLQFVGEENTSEKWDAAIDQALGSKE